MQQLLSLKMYICTLLFLCSGLRADTLGPTTLINNGGNPLGAPPYSCFNTQTNQFFVGWISGFIYSSLYSPDGTQQSGPTLLVDNSGPVNPFTLPGSCYNSTNNEFLISYLGQGAEVSAWFNILDQNGNSIVGPTSLENPGGDQANSLVLCCYNSTNNEYALTWGSVGNLCYFAVIDKTGNVVVPTMAIADATINANGGYNIFISYNSIDNQYFFTWQGLDNNPYYAIYNADGTVSIPATLIPSEGNINAPVLSSSYNSTDNQYLITWNDNTGDGFFAIYNAAGAAVVAATLFANTVSPTNYGSVLSSYNSKNNEYFLTWQGVDGNSHYAIYDADGVVFIGATTIPNVTGVTDFGFVTNSYSVNANAFFISWIGPIVTQDGYYAVYTRTPPPPNPPSQGTGQHNLNRFANYGEYFNTLQWHLSISSDVANYKIYRGDSLIATLPPTQTTYQENNQPNKSVIYSITAVDIYGQESIPLDIRV